MKETIAVLFGGQSSEHVVSCMSAANVIDQIDKDKYDLLLIGITEEGEWILTPSVEEIRNDTWREAAGLVPYYPRMRPGNVSSFPKGTPQKKSGLMWYSRCFTDCAVRMERSRAC